MRKPVPYPHFLAKKWGTERARSLPRVAEAGVCPGCLVSEPSSLTIRPHAFPRRLLKNVCIPLPHGVFSQILQIRGRWEYFLFIWKVNRNPSLWSDLALKTVTILMNGKPRFEFSIGTSPEAPWSHMSTTKACTDGAPPTGTWGLRAHPDGPSFTWANRSFCHPPHPHATLLLHV